MKKELKKTKKQQKKKSKLSDKELEQKQDALEKVTLW